MRLPYIQVSMEVLEQAAPTIAVLLQEDEIRILGGLVKMFAWALGRCPDDRPPSASAVVEGPAAAALIAVAASYRGDPERFVEACEAVRPDPLLERVEGGIRVCGPSRYDAAWRKNNKERARAWDDAHPPDSARIPGGTAPEPELSGAGLGPEPDRQIKKKTQTQTQKETGSPSAALAQCVEKRAAKFPAAVPEDPFQARPAFEQAYADAMETKGMTPERFLRAFDGFLASSYWAAQEPPCPVRVFARKWRDFVPDQRAGADPPEKPRHKVLQVVPKPGGAAG